jgi:hypothetical protein
LLVAGHVRGLVVLLHGDLRTISACSFCLLGTIAQKRGESFKRRNKQRVRLTTVLLHCEGMYFQKGVQYSRGIDSKLKFERRIDLLFLRDKVAGSMRIRPASVHKAAHAAFIKHFQALRPNNQEDSNGNCRAQPSFRQVIIARFAHTRRPI